MTTEPTKRLGGREFKTFKQVKISSSLYRHVTPGSSSRCVTTLFCFNRRELLEKPHRCRCAADVLQMFCRAPADDLHRYLFRLKSFLLASSDTSASLNFRPAVVFGAVFSSAARRRASCDL